MSGRDGLRDKWRLAVLGDPSLHDGVKVTLSAMAMRMSDRGYVSVPREALAELLHKHPRKISEHIARAISIGLLQKTGGGYKGRTAEYVAVIVVPKGAVSGVSRKSEGAGERHPLNGTLRGTETAPKGAVSGVPTTRALEDVPRKRHDGERDVGDAPEHGHTQHPVGDAEEEQEVEDHSRSTLGSMHSAPQERSEERAPPNSALGAGLRSEPGQNSRRIPPAGESDVREALEESVAETRWKSPDDDEPQRRGVGGNPRCQVCDRPRLYSRASIKLGVCASCALALIEGGEPPGDFGQATP